MTDPEDIKNNGGSISVPGRCNRLPQTWWLKIPQVYYLTVQEITSLKLVLWG